MSHRRPENIESVLVLSAVVGNGEIVVGMDARQPFPPSRIARIVVVVVDLLLLLHLGSLE